MAHKIIDTNVPLTAAGLNEQASRQCQRDCVATLRRILSGQDTLVIDDANAVLTEYRNNLYPDHKGSLAEQFMLYAITNQFTQSMVRRVHAAIDEEGQYLDYPDPHDSWRTEVRRCERFDPDDKKWVALALRFKSDTGQDAPIANAADRCWRAFEGHLASAGVALEYLC